MMHSTTPNAFCQMNRTQYSEKSKLGVSGKCAGGRECALSVE